MIEPYEKELQQVASLRISTSIVEKKIDVACNAPFVHHHHHADASAEVEVAIIASASGKTSTGQIFRLVALIGCIQGK